jgi:hypothetical protein
VVFVCGGNPIWQFLHESMRGEANRAVIVWENTLCSRGACVRFRETQEPTKTNTRATVCLPCDLSLGIPNTLFCHDRPCPNMLALDRPCSTCKVERGREMSIKVEHGGGMFWKSGNSGKTPGCKFPNWLKHQDLPNQTKPSE